MCMCVSVFTNLLISLNADLEISSGEISLVSVIWNHEGVTCRQTVSCTDPLFFFLQEVNLSKHRNSKHSENKSQHM